VRVVQAAAPEEAEHAALEGALKSVGVVGLEVGRFIEADGPVALLGEEPVEDDEVEVEVGIEGGAEAVQERDGAQLGVGPGAGAGAAERGADGAEQDAEYGAGECGVARQEGADPLGHGEHPLADGEWGQDVVGEPGGDLDHAAGVAGGTDAAPLPQCRCALRGPGSRSSRAYGMAVTSRSGSPSTRSPAPPSSRSSSQRTSVRLPVSCGRT
jgi:hypothetical protein